MAGACRHRRVENSAMPVHGQHRGIQSRQPLVQPRIPEVQGRVAFIGDVVGQSRKGVDGRDMRPHAPGQQMRGDREVLVVRARQVRTGRIGGVERHYHSLSGTPARALASRARTNSRSESRLT